MNETNETLVCDVYSRTNPRGRYTLVEADVPMKRAFEMVYRLRADESVSWAYCTEPDGTTWPIAGDTEWTLRYGLAPRPLFLHAASIVAAYAHLVDPDITQKAAIEALKRARKAVTGRG